ncbi:putative membrane protein [Hydrogenophaga sp. T4]|nr:putative membrane protein [Hydrogenophaga sp. T4]
MIRSLTHIVRTRRANRQLGGLLAFVAGAANAGGFLAIQRYTSHMTGIVSEIADNLVLGNFFWARRDWPLFALLWRVRPRRRCW